MHAAVALVAAATALSLSPVHSLRGQDLRGVGEQMFGELPFRHIGPVGNRVSAVVGVPGDPNVYYIGAASGGVFKSTDGGVHWEPVFDDQPAASIGSLAIDPTNRNVVWAGTGETFIRSNVSIGNGIYKSTDGGETWRHMGLDATGRIGRIVIHPTNPDVIFAAAMGHLYGPQPERGVFRTTDGGESWEQVLFVDENTGASDIVMDPNNPEILFAGMWQMIVQTWGRESGGPGGGVHMSRDGGTTWEHLTGNGLPRPPLGKIGLAMSPNNSDRVYALIETNSNREFAELDEHQGVLWRSDDGGRSWRMVSDDHTLAQRPLYYTRAAVAPDDHNEIHFLSTAHTISLDGGLTIQRGNAGGDNHDMWIDPLIPDRMIVGHDGGVSISTTRGRSWLRPRLPIAQMYHVYTDNQIPYFVYGNRQDGASHRGPSNTLSGGSIPIGAWHSVGGCESGYSVPDPVDNSIVWSGCYEGILERYDHRTGQARNVSVWPDNPEAWPAADLRYRFQWTFPIAISPHDHNRVYVGSQHVHQTTDGGQSWTVISPDLTTNDKSKQQKTGGLTMDDAGPTYAAVLFAIAESPLEDGVIWAGSNDGLVQVTRNGGADWTNVTANIPDLPPWGTVSNIEPSRFDAGTAYITVDFHQVNNADPFVYKTEDYGRTWKSISSDIPRSVFSYAHVVREDPVRPGLLYLGTENSLFVSFNDGGNWRPLQSNLPHAPVHWLTIQEHFNDLVVATYGRGFWIMDDITPLQQLSDEVLASDVHLFQPRPAYRFRNKESAVSQPGDPGAGENPRYGASLHYYLAAPVSGGATVEIADAGGDVVRRLEGSNLAGINRLYWDLRYEPSEVPRMRTRVIEHPDVEIGDDGWRSGGETGRVAPLAPPGTYTVRLSAGGRQLSEELIVLKDPHSSGSEADIARQFAVMMELRDNADSVVDLIDEIESVREQLYDLEGRLEGIESTAEVVAAGQAIDAKLIDLEMLLTDLRLSGGMAGQAVDAKLIDLEMLLTDLRLSGGMAGQDRLRWPRRLYAKITSLAGYIGGSDFQPTAQQLEVHDLYKVLLADYETQMAEIRQTDIHAFNQSLLQRGFPVIMTANAGRTGLIQ
ncbi:MAG: sialidase [Gemmatimonadetes bacterium]|nr:sialidase [Gemmatimonadota bacterium]